MGPLFGLHIFPGSQGQNQLISLLFLQEFVHLMMMEQVQIHITDIS
jgi:hypothetical protein